jgi:hypothetical protein
VGDQGETVSPVLVDGTLGGQTATLERPDELVLLLVSDGLGGEFGDHDVSSRHHSHSSLRHPHHIGRMP